MGTYRTIKALVFDYIHRCEGLVDYSTLTDEVINNFPQSKWKETHWSWYRYQITRGRFKKFFSEEERSNLAQGQRVPKADAVEPMYRKPAADTLPVTKGPAPKNPEVKRIGDVILNQARFVISLAAGQDANLKFKLNRWVSSRLLQDEIRIKRPIKRNLWDSGVRACQACGQAFGSLKGVETHRKNTDLGYSLENCELLCRECHQELNRHS
ncbi:MAG: HNH endonuclease [Phycisphaerae bacterium]|nr:HNH endonuclease [Phycisphaerae bacterium]